MFTLTTQMQFKYEFFVLQVRMGSLKLNMTIRLCSGACVLKKGILWRLCKRAEMPVLILICFSCSGGKYLSTCGFHEWQTYWVAWFVILRITIMGRTSNSLCGLLNFKRNNMGCSFCAEINCYLLLISLIPLSFI